MTKDKAARLSSAFGSDKVSSLEGMYEVIERAGFNIPLLVEAAREEGKKYLWTPEDFLISILLHAPSEMEKGAAGACLWVLLRDAV